METTQEVQTPAEAYLPAGQGVQPEAPPQPSPVLQAGQSRQEVEPELGWYFEVGQEVQTVPKQSLKPTPFVLSSEWKAKVVLGPGNDMDAGKAEV